MTEELSLPVARVMEVMGCDEEEANRLMHDLVLAGLGEWDTITGNLNYAILWR